MSTDALPLSNQLALDRTRLAYERTLMAWVRTATSLISFGFTIYKFFAYLKREEAPPGRGRPARVRAADDRHRADGSLACHPRSSAAHAVAAPSTARRRIHSPPSSPSSSPCSASSACSASCWASNPNWLVRCRDAAEPRLMQRPWSDSMSKRVRRLVTMGPGAGGVRTRWRAVLSALLPLLDAGSVVGADGTPTTPRGSGRPLAKRRRRVPPSRRATSPWASWVGPATASRRSGATGGSDLFLPGYIWHMPWHYSEEQVGRYNTVAFGLGFGRTLRSRVTRPRTIYGVVSADSYSPPPGTWSAMRGRPGGGPAVGCSLSVAGTQPC